MTNYQFSCKMCSPNNLETFNRKQAGESLMAMSKSHQVKVWFMVQVDSMIKTRKFNL